MPYVATQFTGGTPSSTAISNEFAKIEVALQEYLSRIGTIANGMEEALDMNGHEIVNALTDPDNPNSLVSVEHLNEALGSAQDVAALEAAVATLQGNLVVVSDMVSLLNTSQNQQNTDIANLQSTVALLTVTQAMFDALSGSVTSLTQTVATIQNLAATNEANIQANDADIAANAANITSLSGSITALTQTVQTIQNLAATNEANIAANVATLNSLGSSITALTQTVGTIQNIATTNQADIATLQANVTSLSASITALTATVADNQANIAQLANRPIGFSFEPTLPDSTEVARYSITKGYILRATGGSTATGVNRGLAGTAPTSGNADFEILQNGTVVGTVLFGVNDPTATFDIPADVTFGAGNVLVIRTGTQLELENASFTLHLEEQL